MNLSAKCASLKIDFLCAIYLNSSYKPKFPLFHRKILALPVIVERIWLLYALYYKKSNEMYEHIFASLLDNKKQENDYLKQMASEYFINISQTDRIFAVYLNYDLTGPKKLFPLILSKM